MRPRAVGWPEKYPEFGSRVCPACLDAGRGSVVMKVWLVRCVERDDAFVTYQCPRCSFVDEFVQPIELSLISRPSGEIFAPTPTSAPTIVVP